MVFNEQTYKAHRLALEGKVFFYNRLADPEYAMTYFPPPPSQESKESVYTHNQIKNSNYDRRPRISMPFSGNVINRIASIIYQNATLLIQPESLQLEFDMMMKRLGWPSLGRDIIVRAMYGGMALTTIQPGPLGVSLRHWSGEWTFDDGVRGYMYKIDDNGNRIPITDKPGPRDKYTIVYITDTHWVIIENGQDVTKWNQPHNLGFAPEVMFYNIDVEDDEGYPNPFHIRFRDDLVEYNRLFSKVCRDLRLLESFLATNKNKDGIVDELIVDQEQIAYLGEEGKLWQVISAYDIGPKKYILDKLEKRMSTSAQVPDFMTGLQDAGKIESGVALQIVHQPLVELVNRIVADIEPRFIELFAKCFTVELALKGRADKFGLMMQFEENILPQDDERKMSNISTAIDKGIITPQEARPVALPILGIEESDTPAMSVSEPDAAVV